MEADLHGKNKSKTEVDENLNEYKGNLYKYRTVLSCGYSLDIPIDAGQRSSKFGSTRGHKLNHSFSHMNSKLIYYDSARFGIVSAIVTREALVPKYTEIFVHYGYAFSKGPPWYQNLFKSFLLQNDEIINRKEEKLQDETLPSTISNFTSNTILYQYKLLNKALSGLSIKSIKDASNLVLQNVLKKHALFSFKPISQEEWNHCYFKY